LNTQLTNIECAQIAHIAEIVCKTGLGTVLAEFVGGFEIRTGLGGPGIGKIEKIPLAGYKAIILCISPISTHSILSDYSKSWINSIDGLGTRMLNQLRKSKDVGDFLKMSYDFSSALNLTQGPCKAPIEKLKSHGFDAGVALFGKTVFTLVPSQEIACATSCLREFNGTLIVANVDSTGAKVLHSHT
jgi:pantoate kinase